MELRYCNYSQQRIVLRQGMGEEQTIKTAIHEIAHAEMHNQQKGRVESKKSRPVREVEAESVAYVVCRHYGLDTSEYSFPYIAGWEGRNPQILKESLNVIREAAENLVTEIDEKFLEIVKEKGYQKREIRTKQTYPERKTQVPGKIAPNERQVVL